VNGLGRGFSLRVLGLAALLLSSIACETHAPGSEGPVPQSGSEQASIAADDLISLVLPPWSLEWAEKAIVARCMDTKGFRFLPWETLPWFVVDPEQPRLFDGLTSPQYASNRGYGPALGRTPKGSARLRDPVIAEDYYLMSLDPNRRIDYFRMLMGPKNVSTREAISIPGLGKAVTWTQGCWSRARRRLYGSVHAWLELAYRPQRLMRVVGSVSSDQRVQNAREHYAICMSDTGFESDHPNETLKWARARFGSRRLRGEPPGRGEYRLAATDAACQQQARYQDAVSKAVVDASEDWVTANASTVSRLAQKQRTALREANEILVRPWAVRMLAELYRKAGMAFSVEPG
jgi:hypothetical protein